MQSKFLHTFSAVEIQGLPYGCQAEVDVEKRDGSEDVDFVVCVKSGNYKHCTYNQLRIVARYDQSYIIYSQNNILYLICLPQIM